MQEPVSLSMKANRVSGLHPCGESCLVALVTDSVRDSGFYRDYVDIEGLEPVGQGVGMGDHKALSGFPQFKTDVAVVSGHSVLRHSVWNVAPNRYAVLLSHSNGISAHRLRTAKPVQKCQWHHP